VKSLIFERIASLLFPIIHAFAFFIFLRGHNSAGGGFVAGLISASAFIILALARDVESARRKLPISPLTLTGLGLFLAFAAVWLPGLSGREFMLGLWGSALGQHWGTPQLFDLGVYTVVVGVTQLLIFELLETED
jgi:multicomponent Na+:H+ antiporter subunit B